MATISAVCISCKSCLPLGTRSCPRCRKALRHFKARIKTPEGWLTKQSANLGEVQAWLKTGHKPSPAPADLTFGDVWKAFVPWAVQNLRSWRSYETIWRLRLKDDLGALPLPDVTPERLYGVLGAMSGHSPASRHHVRALISRLFTFARRRLGYRGENPVPYVEPEKFDNTRRRVLSPEEAQRLLAVLKSWPNRRAALLILFLFYSGRRRGEVRQLTFDNVDLERGIVTFPANTTKSKRTNVVPVSQEAWDVLKEAYSLKISDLVFPAITGRYAWHLNNTWKAIRRAADLEDVKIHDLRRGWISRTLARGVGAFIVKDLAGHENITTTQRYVCLNLETLERAVRP